MFERDKVGEEILVEMEKNLRTNAFNEDVKKDQNRLEAVYLLNKAAECFENSGLTNEAEAITRVAQFVVVVKDPATKGLTPEKQIENLKENGITLNIPKEVASKAKKPEYNDAADIEVNESDDMDADDINDLKNLWD